MTVLQDMKNLVTIVDSGKFSGKKRVDLYGYQKHNIKINCIILTGMDIITVIH